MKHTNSVYWAKCAVVLMAVPLAIYAYSTGPDPRKTGAPGDSTCAECHTGTALNSSQGKVEIRYSGGSSYTPGERGKFTVTITDTAGRSRYGFQSSARLANNLSGGQAGTLIAGAGTRVTCANTTGREVACSDAALVQFISHSAASTSGTFTFDWTAPVAGAGNVQVYVAANAANGNGSDSGDRIYTASVTLTPAAASGPPPAVSNGGVSNTWSASTTIAANTWTSIYGSNLATETRTWDGSPEFATGKLPITLGGVSVTIGGKSAPVYFISPGQINVLVPDDTATGNLPLVVKTAAGESQAATVVRAALSPSLLTQGTADGKLRVLGRLNSNASTVLGSAAIPGTRPFAPGDVVQFYATGLGPTTPAVATDTVVTGSPALVNAPSIRINNVAVQILGSALVGSGLYQINGVIPEIADGDYAAVVEAGGVRSPDSIVISIKK